MSERGKRKPSSRFVVHEHKATRLHYDFRLEIGGVLKSWAIPKGPSLNPVDKRLAVMVDDHSLDYADYEGIIPEGSNGAGPVVIWDEGTFDLSESGDPESQLRVGTLPIVLHGSKLKGAYVLTRLARSKSGNGWLLIKRNDEHADPKWKLKSELTPSRLKNLRLKNPPCETS